MPRVTFPAPGDNGQTPGHAATIRLEFSYYDTNGEHSMHLRELAESACEHAAEVIAEKLHGFVIRDLAPMADRTAKRIGRDAGLE